MSDKGSRSNAKAPFFIQGAKLNACFLCIVTSLMFDLAI